MLRDHRPSYIPPTFHGWRFAAIGAVMNALASGFYGRGFTLYFLAIARDLKLSHTSTSLVFGLSSLEGGIQAPITGMFIDRWGPRIMMIIGTVITGIGFLLLPLANSFAVFLLIYTGVISLGAHSGFHNASSAIVNRWFVKRRGTAFGVSSMGVAIGGSLFAPMVAFIVINYGWRMASTVSGLIILILGLPLSYLVRNSPEELGQVPDGAGRESQNTGIETTNTPDFTVREALGTWSYWIMSVGMTLRIAAASGVVVHIVPLMVWKGMGEGTGGVLIATGSVAGIATRFYMGWLGDRWSKRKLVGIAMMVGAGSVIFLLYIPGKLPWMIAFGFAMSVTEGAAGLTWAMIGDFFGKSSYATLRGGIVAMVSLGSIGAPVGAGMVFDITGSYYWVLLPCSVIYILAAIIFLFIRNPKLPVTVNN